MTTNFRVFVVPHHVPKIVKTEIDGTRKETYGVITLLCVCKINYD
jgi:hypothetical protein